jgi:hypothetical protein
MIPIGQWLSKQPSAAAWHILPIVGEMPGDEKPAAGQRLAEAFSKGRCEAEEQAREYLATAMADERCKYETLVDVERRRWLEEQARPLAIQIGTAMAAIEQDLSDCLARLLKPFVVAAVRQTAMAEFKRMLETHLAGGEPKRLQIKAPADLIVRLKQELPHGSLAIEFVESETCEASAEAGTTSFETQIEKWLAAIGADADV